jgi:hypothetical protein
MYIIINSRTGLRTKQTPLADLTFILIKEYHFWIDIIIPVFVYWKTYENSG